MSKLKFGTTPMPNLTSGQPARVGDGWEPFTVYPEFPAVALSGTPASAAQMAEIRGLEGNLNVEAHFGYWDYAAGAYANDWRVCTNRAALYLGFLSEMSAHAGSVDGGVRAAYSWLRIRREAIEAPKGDPWVKQKAALLAVIAPVAAAKKARLEVARG